MRIKPLTYISFCRSTYHFDSGYRLDINYQYYKDETFANVQISLGTPSDTLYFGELTNVQLDGDRSILRMANEAIDTYNSLQPVFEECSL